MGGTWAVLLGLVLAGRLGRSAAAVKIGTMFREREDEHLRQAFQLAVAYVRELPVAKGLDIAYVENIIPHNATAHLARIFCRMAEKGVHGVIAGTDPVLRAQTELLSDQLDIPLFSISPGRPALAATSLPRPSLLLQMFPEAELLDAIVDLVMFWHWNSITYIYEEDTGAARLGHLLQDPLLQNVRIQVIKVDDGDFLAAAKAMKLAEQCDPSTVTSFKECGDSLPRVVLDLPSASVHQFLLAALQVTSSSSFAPLRPPSEAAAVEVGAVDVEHWYLLTSLDMAEMNLELFRHNHARIVGLEARERESAGHAQRFLDHLRHQWVTSHDAHLAQPNFFPMTDSLLVFDSVYALVRGFVEAEEWGGGRVGGAGASCGMEQRGSAASPRPHPHGLTLFNYINSLTEEGLTGRLIFHAGQRYNTTLNILQLGYDGFVNQIGTWNEGNDTEGVVMNRSAAEALWNKHINMTKRMKPHFRVTTIAALPYVKARKGDEDPRFEGFCIDLLERLASDLGFTYAIHQVRDAKYGAERPDGRWDGMIGEILRDEADMAVAPLTVNYARSEQVDFTKPFLSLGISILFRIPGPQKPSLFSFMNPLAADIWIYLGVAIVVVTLAMFTIGRISPYEWNPERKICDGMSHRAMNGDTIAMYAGRYVENPATACHVPGRLPYQQLHNNYSFSGTIWYVASTLMKGGCDFGPKAVSTRLLGGIWWVFTLVIVSAYTANLAAVLTVDRRFIPIKSLEDLANQSVIAYGSLGGGSTSQFFRESRIETHMKIWRAMNTSTKDIFVASNAEGVNKTKTENYAYLMESTSLEFAVQQSCSLTQIGGVLGSRGYGIALKKHSDWTDRISRQILDYGERGIIELMKTKWWKSKYGAVCGGGGSGMKSVRVSLDMENVAGLFVLLLAGIALAVLSVVAEFCIKSRYNAALDKQSLCAEMGQELCFAVRLNSSKRKHTLGRRCSQCDGQDAPTAAVPHAHAGQPQAPQQHLPHLPHSLSHNVHQRRAPNGRSLDSPNSLPPPH